jgi:hypothetical protein
VQDGVAILHEKVEHRVLPAGREDSKWLPPPARGPSTMVSSVDVVTR